jgi:O-methyltransferase
LRKYVKQTLTSLLKRYNYRLVPNNFTIWPLEDKEFQTIFREQAAFGWSDVSGPKIERMYKVFQLLELVRNVDGDWAECGVFKGSTAYLMGSRLKSFSKHNRIYLFDSFQGLSAIDSADAGTFMRETDYHCDQSTVERNLSRFNNYEFMAGWIPSRFPEVSDKVFSFVHIDVDLYHPVKQSLEFFIPRLVDGGIIVMDDYGFDGTPGAFKALNEFELSDYTFWKLPYGQAALIKHS